MTEISVLNNKFENKEKLNIGIDFKPELINVPVVHQVVKAILAGRRQGNASTKTKAEVRGGGKKPFKQKGTGNARQGSSRSPLMPGGGAVFGPKPRSYEQKLNKKVVSSALRSVIVDKFLSGKLYVLDRVDSNGKTKQMSDLLTKKNIENSLVVVSAADSLAIRALSNLKKARGVPVDFVSVYEAVKYENLVIEKEAFQKLINKLV